MLSRWLQGFAAVACSWRRPTTAPGRNAPRWRVPKSRGGYTPRRPSHGDWRRPCGGLGTGLQSSIAASRSGTEYEQGGQPGRPPGVAGAVAYTCVPRFRMRRLRSPGADRVTGYVSAAPCGGNSGAPVHHSERGPALGVCGRFKRTRPVRTVTMGPSSRSSACSRRIPLTRAIRSATRQSGSRMTPA
jgi:hypothetical protein